MRRALLSLSAAMCLSIAPLHAQTSGEIGYVDHTTTPPRAILPNRVKMPADGLVTLIFIDPVTADIFTAQQNLNDPEISGTDATNTYQVSGYYQSHGTVGFVVPGQIKGLRVTHDQILVALPNMSGMAQLTSCLTAEGIQLRAIRVTDNTEISQHYVPLGYDVTPTCPEP